MMIVSALILVILLLVVVFILYINSLITVNRYADAIEEINNDKVFTTKSVKLTESRKTYSLTLRSTENVYAYSLSYIDSSTDVHPVTINPFVDTISIDLDDYTDAVCLFGSITLKTEITVK